MGQNSHHLHLMFLQKTWLHFRLSLGHKNCFCIQTGYTWHGVVESERELTAHVCDFQQIVQLDCCEGMCRTRQL